jgi:hypothetical protein
VVRTERLQGGADYRKSVACRHGDAYWPSKDVSIECTNIYTAANDSSAAKDLRSTPM